VLAVGVSAPLVKGGQACKIQMLSSALDMHLSRNLPEPIRVGVIGVGNMGQHHTRVLESLQGCGTGWRL
jgi:hypothetical protein